MTRPSQVAADVVLDVSGLTKTFGSGATAVRAVDGVHLLVRTGEILLVMGPSGSGKTTLLTMVGGLLRPDSGSVTINGQEITTMTRSQISEVRRHVVGFVFQSFNLLEALSAAENVELAMNLAGANGSNARGRAREILTDFGMAHRLGARPRTLSGGEKQRVSIARALANDPMLILADEPTANLDSRHGREVVTLLRDIAKGQGRAVLIVSHDQRIREVADRVLWLEDGRIRDIGQMVKDPVCGMGVEVDRAVSMERDGRVFHFCSCGCSWEFRASPERFMAGAGEGRN